MNDLLNLVLQLKGWGGLASFAVVCVALALGYFKFVPELVKARAEAIRVRAEAARIAAETEAVELAGYRNEVSQLRAHCLSMQSSFEERMNKAARSFDERMAAADRRHRECEERNEDLSREVRRLNRVIQGILDQVRQAGITAIHLFEPKGGGPSEDVRAAADRLGDMGLQIPPKRPIPPAGDKPD